MRKLTRKGAAMQMFEKIEMNDETPAEKKPSAVTQLALAFRRSEEALHEDMNEALAEAVRRAEAVLFAAGEPMSATQIAEILPHGVEAAEVLMTLRALYVNRGVNLVEVAGKWRFQTAQDLSYLFVEERQVQKKLSQAALETLAIIAYGQPVTRAEIEAVRGVAVSKAVLDTLMETGWIKIKGRRKTPGQPLTYGTTDAFLEHFGLESLSTLPGKADLEAEGLLSDVIPDGFQMPDEEALSEEELLVDAGGDTEEIESFVTDFMDDAPDEEEAEADAETLPAPEDIVDDVNADTDDEEDEGISVFAYTRAPVRSVADEEEFDRDDIKAAVMRLRKEERTPEQPISEWNDDE
ncbi:SMC-Scp complex subunit ScpB [uncultured Hyphomonas sp.]|uniref:SMC-Scp complex subunit ScpB n=1 Tax=uncultured Hyphomonas sp. TaxID=225298 RepID=UPI002AAC4536|nr:SMC-Scp complex subunit ScpB [uncultured Hyphomonas sp.]